MGKAALLKNVHKEIHVLHVRMCLKTPFLMVEINFKSLLINDNLILYFYRVDFFLMAEIIVYAKVNF